MTAGRRPETLEKQTRVTKRSPGTCNWLPLEFISHHAPAILRRHRELSGSKLQRREITTIGGFIHHDKEPSFM